MSCNFSAVDNCIQRIDKLLELFDTGGSLVIDIAVDLEESKSDSTNNDSQPLLDLQSVASTYAKMDIEMKQYKKAAEKTKKAIVDILKNHPEQERIVQLKFEDIFKEILLECQKDEATTDINEHRMIRQFSESVWKAKQNETPFIEESCDDGEVLISQSIDVNVMCPLTKVEMEEPVRNTTCGHSYSRKAIETHIKRMGGKARCPVVGCANFVRKDELESNKSLDLLIKKRGRIA